MTTTNENRFGSRSGGPDTARLGSAGGAAPDGGAAPGRPRRTKLIVLLIIGALLGIGTARQKREDKVPDAMFWLVGILTLVNAGIAVLWR